MSAITIHCSFADCAKLARTRGWCDAHYARFLKYGDPAISSRICLPKEATTSERFWAKVRQSGGCWEWIGARGSGGYGRFWDREKGRTFPAHRWAYEQLVTVIPPGLDLDHLCRNRACVNPGHLEPVTRRVNSLRGLSPTIQLHFAGQCGKGHHLTPENTYTGPDGHSRCRICMRAKNRRYARRRKEAGR